MRELKFRAWDETREDLHDWGWLKDCMYQSTHWDEVEEDYQFMQYTGLKDKNGVEIYEGDIVSWVFPFVIYQGKTTENVMSPYKVVEFKEGAYNIADFQSFIATCYVVMGNIYENPELLESE